MNMERPIIFGSEMVNAILQGRKTQTRRVVKPQPTAVPGGFRFAGGTSVPAIDFDINTSVLFQEYELPLCPYGKTGERLWVRETYSVAGTGAIFYRADSEKLPEGWAWRSPIFMHRWASRITLKVVSVRVERLHGISREDVICEGLSSFVSNLGYTRSDPKRIYQVSSSDEGGYTNPIEAFENLWNSINAKRGYGWDSNPWVWRVEFERVSP